MVTLFDLRSESEDEHQLIDTYCAAMNGDGHSLGMNGSLSAELGLSPIQKSNSSRTTVAGAPSATPLNAHAVTGGSSSLPQSRVPAQTPTELSPEQNEELDMMIQELEHENRQLQAEYERLQDMR